MPIQVKHPTFDQIVADLRAHKFDVRELSGDAGGVQIEKNNCGAILQRAADGKSARLTANPGYLVGGQISRLLDRGYQKFLKTSKLEVPATADHLKAVHVFSEELREIAGNESLYNESLGTVSDVYLYDRVKDREASVTPSASGGH